MPPPGPRPLTLALGRSAAARYLLAITLSTAAYGVTSLLEHHAIPNFFLLFLVAIGLATAFGGTGPGILSTVVGVGLATFGFASPIMSFAVDRLNPLERLLAYTVVSVVTLLASAGLRKARNRIAQSLHETERILEALKESEWHLRLVTEQAPAILWTTDAHLRFTSCTGKGLAPLGLESGQLIGLSLQEFFKTQDPDFPPIRSHLLALQGESLSYETDWGGRTFGCHVEVLKDSNGRAIGVVGLALDVTNEKKALAEIRKLNETLEDRVAERTAALEIFTHSVAHDLRSPLRVIKGFSEVLLSDYRGQLLTGEGELCLERIASGVDRMDVLIRDLLAYSRLDRQDLPLSRMDPSEVVDQALGDLKQDLEKGAVRVEVQSPFPPLLGHAVTLPLVLENLISNAIKFVVPGKRPEVRIWGEKTEGRVRLCVEDNGIGIAPEFLDRIFRPFERLHRPEEYPGTGMGLAIVRKAVERMGGQVGVFSEPGRGSRFWVELRAA